MALRRDMINFPLNQRKAGELFGIEVSHFHPSILIFR